MPHVETLNEGLKRAYTLTIPAADIEARIEGELQTIAPSVRMPGFRPGKVPANLVRKMHGPQLMQQALETSVREGVDALMAAEKLRPAMAPSSDRAIDPTGCRRVVFIGPVWPTGKGGRRPGLRRWCGSPRRRPSP